MISFKDLIVAANATPDQNSNLPHNDIIPKQQSATHDPVEGDLNANFEANAIPTKDMSPLPIVQRTLPVAPTQDDLIQNVAAKAEQNRDCPIVQRQHQDDLVENDLIANVVADSTPDQKIDSLPFAQRPLPGNVAMAARIKTLEEASGSNTSARSHRHDLNQNNSSKIFHWNLNPNENGASGWNSDVNAQGESYDLNPETIDENTCVKVDMYTSPKTLTEIFGLVSYTPNEIDASETATFPKLITTSSGFFNDPTETSAQVKLGCDTQFEPIIGIATIEISPSIDVGPNLEPIAGTSDIAQNSCYTRCIGCVY